VDDEVRRSEAEPRPATVVLAVTTWPDFSSLWGSSPARSGTACTRGGIYRGCRTNMVYFDSVPNIKVGVLLDRPCPLTGRVVSSASPAGTAAMTVHRGCLADLKGGR
jgi:hypothetical protein